MKTGHTPPSALTQLRADSHYPELRAVIDLLWVLGIIALMLGGVAMVGHAGEAGETGYAFLGVGVILASGVWWKLFRPLASLLVDIADACVEISRR